MMSRKASNTGSGLRRSPRILIGDDDPTYREWLRHHLDALCQDAAITVVGFAELLARVDAGEALSRARHDIVLMVAGFGTSPDDPKAVGLDLLRKLRGRGQLPAIIAVAQEGNELTAVRAIQLGAADYLPKRLLTPERLRQSMQVTLRRLALNREESAAAAPSASAPPPGDEGQETGTRAVSAPVAPAPEAPKPTGQTAVAEPEPALPMELIPGFFIFHCIGKSETSSVYLAAAKFWGKVALKVSKTLRDPVAGRQFMEREYSAITHIRSRSVATILDYGVHGAYEYLVMEYLPRGNLRTRMQQGLSEEDALHYANSIARALKVIHEAGILHRDLKPPNVLLREDNEVALIDFGLARSVDGTSGGTLLRGSPFYMSPEHALGAPLDVRSDLYSFGIILYEMLTGQRPFVGSTAKEVLQAHVSTPMPTLPAGRARYQELLERLLAKRRADRFANATELLAALAQLRPAGNEAKITTA